MVSMQVNGRTDCLCRQDCEEQLDVMDAAAADDGQTSDSLLWQQMTTERKSCAGRPGY
jgi:hypothetical protein